jgi:hypothetical protein
MATPRRYSLPMLWVKEVDFDRAALLVDQMAEAMKNPPSGWWRCRSCGEDSEALFDACWNCGAEQPEPRRR